MITFSFLNICKIKGKYCENPNSNATSSNFLIKLCGHTHIKIGFQGVYFKTKTSFTFFYATEMFDSILMLNPLDSQKSIQVVFVKFWLCPQIINCTLNYSNSIRFYLNSKNHKYENILWSKKHKFLDLAMFSKNHRIFLKLSQNFMKSIWIVGPLGQAKVPVESQIQH